MGQGRVRMWAAGFAALSILTSAAAPAVAEAPRSSAEVAVVVSAGSSAEAAQLLARHGGEVERELSLIGGAAGRIGEDAVARLDALDGVQVSPDERVDFASSDLVAAPATASDLQLAAMNPGSDWSLETGSGVGVALLDTGVAQTPDLVGRVVHGPDYSDEGDGIDRYGHGTFMAGLIAGDGSASADDTIPHWGSAPGAHIVSLKLAGRDGVTSLSKVLDAIGWVVTNQDEYGIRVLNLSIGVRTNRAPQADPLSAAVEAVWASGITVVAASGNEGTGTVTSPGRDPWVITVGSTDTEGTVDTADDTVPAWSGSGRVTRTHKPELLAPGVSVVSLRAPGSLIDEQFSEARIKDDYFRGSGTSMSTALVSGAVAALAEFRPLATPDDLKGALVSTGGTVSGTPSRAIDMAAADAAEPSDEWNQNHGIVFNGLDGRLKRGMPWAQAAAPGPGTTWQRARWADGQWQRAGWAEGQWQRAGWAEGQWQRAGWAGTEFARAGWADADFTRAGWAGANFTRAGWADTGFARAGWADANFARAGWADANFTRAGWAEADWARAGWAGANWANDGTWVRAGWAAALWDAQSAP